MKLSVVICVYNTKKSLLEECLSSLSLSTVPIAEREIIVVDDGSETECRDIAFRFGARYERLGHVGTLAARLHGVMLAQGEYITFVDSDDTLSFNYHLPMLNRAEEGYDIVFNAWAFHSAGTRYFCTDDDSVSGSVESAEPLKAFLLREGRQHCYYVLWNKIYRAEILKLAARELLDTAPPRPFCFSEDTLINLFAFKHARRITSVRSGFYFYRIHSEQTVNITSKERLIYQINCMSYTLGRCKDTVSGRSDERALLRKIDGWASLMARGHFANAKSGGYAELYPYIKSAYGVAELAPPTRRDSAIYENVRLLPSNSREVEAALLSLYAEGGTIKVKRPRRGGYAELLLYGLSLIGREIIYGRKYPALPRERIPLIKRIIFNPTVRRIGALIFKKGSRARAFLKRFI
ncbi:MAG: glycosyltransferase family 2 protein [Clostridia bacterium]|nr:glycosyltransferase family 2 protein [Clostridia bacterium]